MTRVFDPLDGECEYEQNPTNQSNTVDKGFQPFCERLLLLELLRRGIEDALQGIFNPFDGECKYTQVSDKTVENS
ncbi:MAG: hypothetical protein FWC11_06110 [Firmicutes bacterium]|nr:hypothetical protein [Bacillota bacterium]